MRIGLNAELNYKLGGQSGGGSWTEVEKARDVEFDGAFAEGDASNRSSDVRLLVATLKEWTIEFDVVWDPEDAAVQALRDAWLARDVIGVQALDIENGEGPQFDAQVFQFSRPEPLEGVMVSHVIVKPTYSDTPPQWVNASS